MSAAPHSLAPLVIAVDGTSGSGKSSTSRGVARRLGFRYLDTGAQFRAMTVWMLAHGVDVHDADRVAARAGEPVIHSGTDPLAPTITVDGRDVTEAIRSEETTANVSPVAVVPAVRTVLLDLQRGLIRDALAQGTGIVVEGRDIGSVVWPEAALKVYMSADPEARAARRALESGADAETTLAVLSSRDRIDSTRATAPLVVPEGAVHVDTTHHSLGEVIEQIVGLVP